MKYRLSNLLITAYVLSLLYGFVSISLHLAVPGQTYLYFLTFNMFCGWSSFEARVHVIGEGQSGTFYELAPGPWGEFDPYSSVARHNYDAHFDNQWALADNALKHTRHEPVVRVYVVEEEYPKRLNLPAAQYQAYYGKPKVYHSYYSVRSVMDPRGQVLNQQLEYLRQQDQLSIIDNPRLVADSWKHHSLELTDGMPMTHGVYATGQFYEPESTRHLGPPVAE